MPATAAGNQQARFVYGVDGCRAGWVVARLNLYDNQLSGFVADRFETLLQDDHAKAQMIIVDMPIGLATEGKRACEAMARAKLKPLRHSSVFSSPPRPMLGFETYAEANAWGKAQQHGGGLSKQAWMIAPKIREIDNAVTPTLQARIGEGHPEVAFLRLNKGAPCVHPKRTEAGQQERRRLLQQAGLPYAERLFEDLRQKTGAKGLARDDVYDACTLVLTAKARLDGGAIHLTDNAKDDRGLLMEIWG